MGYRRARFFADNMDVILQQRKGACLGLIASYTLTAPMQCLVLVVDSTDRDRLGLVREELYKMLANEELARAQLLVYANKQDVKGAMSASEISIALNLSSIKSHSWHIQGCCALTGEGLFSGLEWITTHLPK